MFPQIAFSNFINGTMVSLMVHLGTGGGMYYWFVKREPPPIVADLDLTMAPLVPTIPNAGGRGGAKPVEDWTISKKKKASAQVTPVAVETKEQVVKQENAAPPCTNCPTTGDGEGQYIPVEAASRKPRWIRNFITTQDYPPVAREQGRDGRVVLTVLIDSNGRVRDARLLQGSYEVLNEVALRKVKNAVFSPAYDKSNKPVSCKVTLPIRFELR